MTANEYLESIKNDQFKADEMWIFTQAEIEELKNLWCKEQREICATMAKTKSHTIDNIRFWNVDENSIKNAPEPE